jgi:hypothetical protein
VATNLYSENARSRIEGSSAGKHEYGGKENDSSTGHMWATGFYLFKLKL